MIKEEIAHAKAAKDGKGGSRVRGTRFRADLEFWMFNFL